MKNYGNQNGLDLRIIEFSRRVESALSLSRGDPILQKDYVSPVNQGRFSVIGKLEASVSMLQTARINIEKLKSWLQEMKEFLEKDRNRSNWARVPSSVINNFLSDRLSCIKVTTETASFQGKKLLNGDSGVKGETSDDHIRFIRGSARVLSSEMPGYPITIYQSAKPGILVGSGMVSESNLRNESIISITSGVREARYRIKENEVPEKFVENLQQCLLDNGIDISVYRTKDNHLFLRHNQLGSRSNFQGMSHHTNLISTVPGEYKEADPGMDIEGTIGSEKAHGDGGFLIGNKGNKKTDGLIIYYDGLIDYPGQIIGYVHVKQNGILVPLDASEHKMEILSIPSITLDILAAGVNNNSGFSDLGAIKGNTELECQDSIHLIIWSMTYLDFLIDELKWKEKIYVDRAVELLRSTISPQSAEDDMIYLSKDKAKDMVTQLKSMLTPVTVMKVTAWK
ncbi:hypothetical protein KJ966_27160 [bacterium]|nr:hypothetical protein [bacterium]